MTSFEIWGSLDRFRSAGEESTKHLWGKVELGWRQRNRVMPWFPGEYRFERKVADRVPDCFVLGERLNRWIEFVAGSDQPYREKTREALRLGFVVHWVFHVDHADQMQDALRALEPDLQQPFRFGVYDPERGVLKLGDPITYKNFVFPVEGMVEFTPKEFLGYRAGAARVRRYGGGFDLGQFRVNGCQRRVISLNPQGTYFRASTPSQSIDDAPWGYPTRKGLERLVEDGQVTRLGPVGYRDRDKEAADR